MTRLMARLNTQVNPSDYTINTYLQYIDFYLCIRLVSHCLFKFKTFKWGIKINNLCGEIDIKHE